MKTNLVLFLAAHTCLALAQSPGTFTATGSMTTLRVGHTATLLTNGKVLMAGGGNHGESFSPDWICCKAMSVLASAELYDPASGTFSRTGDMTTPRTGHTATLLPDGRVLIAGGQGPSGTALASAEVYDPASGTFAPTGDMIYTRGYPAAILLASDKVLIAGGQVWQVKPSFTAELYDPSTATFTTVGPLPVNASQLTLLADGKILLQGTDEAGLFKPALYDPLTNALRTEAAPIREYWQIVTATLLTTGRVLDTRTVTDEGWPTYIAELYDPSTGAFAPGKMAAFRRQATATLLPDATVLIAGGGDSDLGWSNAATSGAELYDSVADMFSITGSMAENREGHTATLLPDGTVLIAGGGINFFGTATAEIYHPNVLIAAPALLSLSGASKGQGAILHAGTTRVASAEDPASVGEVLEIYFAWSTIRLSLPKWRLVAGWQRFCSSARLLDSRV
jgi:hypothetical protein